MKLYPSPHRVETRGKQKFLDIPLAHIEKEYYPESVGVEISEDFLIDDTKKIAPYQKFSRSDFLAFNDNEEMESIHLEYADGAYTFLPDGKEFQPETFSVSLELKRKNIYLSTREYAWTVGANTEMLAKKLLTIFGDASWYGNAPANIIVNGGTKDTDAFVSANTPDFQFVESYDPKGTMDMGQCIDFDGFLNQHTTAWISVDKNEAQRYFVDACGENETSFSTMFSERLGTPYLKGHILQAASYNHKATITPRVPALENLGYSCINSEIFKTGSPSPVIVYEKEGKGCVIVAHEDMLKNPHENFRFIYNTMMIAYLRGYKISKTISSWITDVPVDSIGTPSAPFNRRHEKIMLEDLLEDATDLNYYDIYDTNISNSNVILSSNNNGELGFEKISATDPEIPPGGISILTHKKTILTVDSVKMPLLIEKSAIVSGSIEDDNLCYVTLQPFLSSSKRICVSRPQKFRIKDILKPYILVALPIDDDGESSVMLIEEEDYEPGDGIYQVAKVQVVLAGESIAYDVRMMGGGLPETLTDYDMMDIGALRGRPCREGAGAIVRIPKTYEKYDEKIRQAIEKYKVAADRIYVVYV